MWPCYILESVCWEEGLEGRAKFSNKVAQKYEDKYQEKMAKERNLPGDTVDKNPPC